jgi:cell division protein FtsI/penicillin-binding protein 2
MSVIESKEKRKKRRTKLGKSWRDGSTQYQMAIGQETASANEWQALGKRGAL